MSTASTVSATMRSVAHDGSRSEWVFRPGPLPFRLTIVTGACRSGKTLVGQLLATMKAVDHLDEAWLPMMLPPIQSCGLVEREAAQAILRCYLDELQNDAALMRTANLRPSDASSVWAVKSAAEVFHRLAVMSSRADVRRHNEEQRAMLVLNLAETVPFLDFLRETAPECRILHVVRDGRSIATEVAAKQWWSDAQLTAPLNNQIFRKRGAHYLPWWLDPDRDDAFLTASDWGRGAIYWSQLLSRGFDQIERLRGTDAYREIRFADLIGAPETVAQSLIDHLDVERTERTAEMIARLATIAPPPIDDARADLEAPDRARFDETLARFGFAA